MRAMRLFSLSYLLGWAGTCLSSFFTALNRPGRSLILAFSKTLVFPLACLAVLPAALGLDGVWLTAPAAGVLTAALAVWFFDRSAAAGESPGPAGGGGYTPGVRPGPIIRKNRSCAQRSAGPVLMNHGGSRLLGHDGQGLIHGGEEVLDVLPLCGRGRSRGGCCAGCRGPSAGP